MFRYFNLLLLSILPLFVVSSCQLQKHPPIAVKGIINLANWSLEKNGPLFLNGEWEFYWNQLLTPDDLNDPSLEPNIYQTVPKPWNGLLIDGIKLHGKGFATYRLKIENITVNQELAVRIRDEATSYKLWINGQQLISNGVVSSNPDSMVPQFLPQTAFFTSDSRSMELVLQISNFKHAKGGMWRALELGSKKQITKAREKNIAVQLFLFGSLLIISFYHLGLFINRKKEFSALYFGLLCLLIATRVVLTGERWLFWWFPHFNWEIAQKLEYITFFLSIAVYILFFSSLFEEISKVLSKYVGTIAIALCAITLVTPAAFYTKITPLSQVFASFVALYCTVRIFSAAINRREGAILLFSGNIIFIFALFHDFIVINHFAIGNQLVPLGMFGYILVQALVISKRFSKAFENVEALSLELKKMDQIKDEFLANTSHELRTPLNGIKGIASSLLDGVTGELNTIQKENIRLIANSGQRLSALINDILDFSKLKNHDIQLVYQPVDLRAVVNVVVSLSQHAAAYKKIEIRNNVPHSLPLITADENRLQQILHNLIDNAVKFTDEGFVTVSAELDTDYVIVSIADTGEGIQQEDQDKIFNSFEQLDGSTNRVHSGTGLGLTITKQLVEVHGGIIDVESEPNQGSVFSFSLPLKIEKSIQGEIPNQQSASGSERNLDLQNPPIITPVVTAESDIIKEVSGDSQIETSEIFKDLKVLVTDDEPVNLKVIENNLLSVGIKPYEAISGSEALDMLQEVQPDIVLLDVMMPRLNGFETAAQIRKRFSKEELPIIFLTAKSQFKDQRDAFAAGGNDYIVKPIEKNKLLLRIDFHVKLSQSIRNLMQAERKYRSIFNNASEGIVLLKEDGRLISANPAFATMLGYETTDHLKTKISNLAVNAFVDPLQIINIKEELNHKTQIEKHELQCYRSDRSIVDFSVSIQKIADSESDEFDLEAIFTDVTSQKIAQKLKLEKEAAELANQVKSDYLAYISHELRSPLHVIMSYIQLALKPIQDSPENTSKYLKSIHRSSKTLLAIIDDLLDLSKLEAGKMNYEFKTFSISNVLDQVLNEFEAMALENKIIFKVNKPSSPDYADFDQEKIGQVIRNLVSNAIKFSPENSTIKIDLLKSDTSFEISIADRGEGIPEEHLDTVFEKFVQGKKSKSIKGTGLGLAISNQIIKDHQGRIWAENHPQGGAVFKFTLPINAHRHTE